MNNRTLEGSRNRLPEIRIPFFKEYGETDRIFAVLYLFVGYGFIYVCSSQNFERNLAIFTACYAAVVLSYLKRKKICPPGESWFWLTVMLATGIPFAFWSMLDLLQVLALLAVAAYWTLSASGRLLKDGRTSRWIFFDAWNAMAAVPLCNFGRQIHVLFPKKIQEEKKRAEGIGSIFLGILLTIPVLVIILPLLVRADAGFQQLAGCLADYLCEHLMTILIRMLFAVPVSFYLYGLVFGGIHKKNTDRFQEERLVEAVECARIIPDGAVCTALTIICLIYCLFAGIQGNYLLSAFMGRLPEGFTYAEYARRGFFELCQIGAWNLIFSGGSGILSKTDRREHKGLGFLTGCLVVLTLCLLATAVSKMGMYICVYGLTVYRILPLVFMLWMGLVFVCVILHQSREFPIIRFCVMAGAVMFCMMCVFPVERWTELYNVWARAKGLIV